MVGPPPLGVERGELIRTFCPAPGTQTRTMGL